MKRLYVTATKVNDGKTVVALGLCSLLTQRGKRCAFIKPLGLKDVRTPGYEVDEDALLLERTLKLHAHIQDMSPITVDRTSVGEFAKPEKQRELLVQIEEAFARVTKDADAVVVEGTGHAGVGSVFGLSNARVAAHLRCKVLLVTSGGVGHPLDEVALNISLFQKYGVDVIGVVFNKVRSHEVEKIKSVGADVLKRLGTRLLGIIPYNRVLDCPTMMDILERLRGRLLLGEKHLSNRVESVQIGAMSAHNALPRLKNRALLITAGDRTDLLLAVAVRVLSDGGANRVAGVVLTGGILPDPKVLDVLRKLALPVISVEDDSYTAAIKVKTLDMKISPKDDVKIGIVRDIAARYIDIDTILNVV
ncbi:MAG: hypothetical protein DRP63_00260 [Planctomycetota bacterium]|nr:MAG: hypothetical protein DRP63_00260 [Planctomycetota bacterium]